MSSKAVRDAENKAKQYQDEVHSLRMRLNEAKKSKESQPPPSGSNYNNWTREQLVRELMSIDRAVERFTKENEALMFENKKQRGEIQELNSLLHQESQKLEDYKHKMLKETESVMVVDDEKQLHVKALNNLGLSNAITQKELKELKQKLFTTEKSKNDIEQELAIKEVDYKAQIDQLREERIEAERKMIGLDSSLKTQLLKHEQAQEDHSNIVHKLQSQKDEAVKKLDWYLENQDMLDVDQEKLKLKDDRIDELKEEISQLKSKDGGRKRTNTLEKEVRILKEALAKKNPDSIPMMLSAMKPTVEEQEEYRKLKDQINKLNRQLIEKDEEFERTIRNLRLESDKMKARYDKSKSTLLSEDDKNQRIEDLERQVQDTKQYYQDRIKKLENASAQNSKKSQQIKSEMHLLNRIKDLMKDNQNLKQISSKNAKQVRTLQNQIKNKDVSADLLSVTEKLVNDDYSFTLARLYRKTLDIKQQLARSSFKDAFSNTESFIDDVDNASQKFNTSKAYVLFTKITQKCLELAEIIQTGIDQGNSRVSFNQ